MAKVKVVWTKMAIADLQNAYEYVVEQDPKAVVSVIEKIEKASRMVAVIPHMGRAGRVAGTRELGALFVLPYRMRSKQIEILAVIPASRRWPEEF